MTALLTRRSLSSVLLFTTIVQSVLGFDFKKLSSGEHMNLSDTFENTRSLFECSNLCVKRLLDDGVRPMCVAFNYNTLHRRCQLYVTHTGGMDASGVSVYKYHYDRFHYITKGGHTYIYYISLEEMSFQDAREHCHALGAYLLNFDSSHEFDVLKEYVRRRVSIGFWVGANDIDSEGDWVRDKDHQPLDFTVWKFYKREPNDRLQREDCGAYNVDQEGLLDIPCFHTRQTICERTPGH